MIKDCRIVKWKNDIVNCKRQLQTILESFVKRDHIRQSYKYAIVGISIYLRQEITWEHLELLISWSVKSVFLKLWVAFHHIHISCFPSHASLFPRTFEIHWIVRFRPIKTGVKFYLKHKEHQPLFIRWKYLPRKLFPKSLLFLLTKSVLICGPLLIDIISCSWTSVLLTRICFGILLRISG